MIQIIHTILLIIYIIVCVALTVIVLMQEGKQAGLSGAINGAAGTYWGKNKGRSMEGGNGYKSSCNCIYRIIIDS